MTRWDRHDPFRLLMAVAFLSLARHLIGETPLWWACLIGTGITLLGVALLVLVEMGSRWIGLRRHPPGTGPTRTG